MFPDSSAQMYPARPLVITLLMLVMALAACNDHVEAPVSHTAALRELNAGYAILRTTLRDQQHLKTIRLTKSLMTFKPVSKPTRQIIDDIAEISSTALEELEQLASQAPEIDFDTGRDEDIERMTSDALRTTTAKEFLTSREDFELILLISQTQALRYISHLARELRDIDTNTRRRVWLAALSDQFEKLYLQVLSRLKIA